jgi:surface antigen
MNPALVLCLASSSIKKYFLIALATITIAVALPVMTVFALGDEAVSLLSSYPSAESAEQGGFYMGPGVPGSTYAWGNCTYWAYAMRYWAHDPIPGSWGDAHSWDDYARADGYVVDHTPAIGAVFQTDEGSLGHVAYVINVDKSTGKWTISEMNAPKFNTVSTRTFTSTSAVYYNFIHDKKAAP